MAFLAFVWSRARGSKKKLDLEKVLDAENKQVKKPTIRISRSTEAAIPSVMLRTLVSGQVFLAVLVP